MDAKKWPPSCLARGPSKEGFRFACDTVFGTTRQEANAWIVAAPTAKVRRWNHTSLTRPESLSESIRAYHWDPLNVGGSKPVAQIAVERGPEAVCLFFFDTPLIEGNLWEPQKGNVSIGRETRVQVAILHTPIYIYIYLYIYTSFRF